MFFLGSPKLLNMVLKAISTPTKSASYYTWLPAIVTEIGHPLVMQNFPSLAQSLLDNLNHPSKIYVGVLLSSASNKNVV